MHGLSNHLFAPSHQFSPSLIKILLGSDIECYQMVKIYAFQLIQFVQVLEIIIWGIKLLRNVSS